MLSTSFNSVLAPHDHLHINHVSAEMSLRYGRLFDATVREGYEPALHLAKARLGPADAS